MSEHRKNNEKMWPTRTEELRNLEASLERHDNLNRALPGVATKDSKKTLAMQIVASLRREEYYRLVQQKQLASERADPNSARFDAERAVAYHMQTGNTDEAAWLVFLMTHFAKPVDTGWMRLQRVYGRLGKGLWDWKSVSEHPQAFVDWMSDHWREIGGRFGNHRKYESLRPDAKRNIGAVVLSYLEWIGQSGHDAFFANAVRDAGNDPNTVFDHLFENMSVVSFGRLGKFDYLALIGRYGIAPVSAGSAYLAGATGPSRGARLLFDGRWDSTSTLVQLQDYLDELDGSLGVGMTVLEDALCNWQKSSEKFVHFRG